MENIRNYYREKANYDHLPIDDSWFLNKFLLEYSEHIYR